MLFAELISSVAEEAVGEPVAVSVALADLVVVPPAAVVAEDSHSAEAHLVEAAPPAAGKR